MNKKYLNLVLISLALIFTGSLAAQDSEEPKAAKKTEAKKAAEKEAPAKKSAPANNAPTKSAPANNNAPAANPAPQKKKTPEEYLQDLNGEDTRAKIVACRELGKAQVEQAIKPLIGILTGSPDKELRWNAAMALGMIKKAGETTQALLTAAKDDKSKTVRYTSLLGLANIQDKNKINEFLDVARWTRDNSNDDLAKDLATLVLKKYKK